MTIVLNEGAADPVGDAVLALVEAAMASELEMTPETLKEMVDAQIAILTEAGGLMSWIKRHYTGVYHNDPGEFEDELRRGVHSEAHRNMLIGQINAMIDKAHRAQRGSAAGDFVKGFIPGFVVPVPGSGIAGGVARAVATGSNRRSGEILRYIDALEAVKKKIQTVKLGRPD